MIGAMNRHAKIDEVGYLTYGPDAANVLFQVVNDRALHHRPMIFTTNKEARQSDSPLKPRARSEQAR